MAFMLASTSAIDLVFKNRAAALRSASDAPDSGYSAAPIRRPYRGIQIKEDTYATMQIVDASGNTIPLVSESSTGTQEGVGYVSTYADFVLQRINEDRVEKQQIIETFGDSYIFFFGERPRMLSSQGVLVNTEDFGWRAQFMHNYENNLRGTRLVQKNARLYLSWDTIVIDGYPLNVTAQESTDNPHTVEFQMQIFLTNYTDFGRIGLVEFPGKIPDGGISSLNRELRGRDRYISTTLEVRKRNFLSRGEDGRIGSMRSLGNTIREGIRAANNVFGLASGFIQDLHSFLSGRVVRTPIGVAGYIEQVGQGGVLGVGLDESLIQAFTTGGITNTNLRIPARPSFAETPENRLRTRISENYDEYPLLTDSTMTLGRSWSLSPTMSAIALQERRRLREVAQSAELVAKNNLAQAEAGVLDAFQDTIMLAKTGFAIFNTTKAVLANPKAVALDSLGLSGIGGLVR